MGTEGLGLKSSPNQSSLLHVLRTIIEDEVRNEDLSWCSPVTSPQYLITWVMRFVFVNRYFHHDHSATSQVVSDLPFISPRAGGRSRRSRAASCTEERRARLPRRENVRGVEIIRIRPTTLRAGVAFRPRLSTTLVREQCPPADSVSRRTRSS